jgi:hypothetical protein
MPRDVGKYTTTCNALRNGLNEQRERNRQKQWLREMALFRGTTHDGQSDKRDFYAIARG